MLACSQVFHLRSALKLLSASHEDTGTTNKKFWSAPQVGQPTPTPPLEASWGPLLPLYCCYRGICFKREATALKENLCSALGTDLETHPIAPWEALFPTFAGHLDCPGQNSRQTEPPHHPTLKKILPYSDPLFCQQIVLSVSMESINVVAFSYSAR